MKLLLIQFIQFKFSSEIRRNPTVRVFEAFFIRYGAYTYNCMRYPSLTRLSNYLQRTMER